MTKTCSSCGAKSTTEARFCRLCGAPFSARPDGQDRDASVSPLAETIPLSDEGRVTNDNLAADNLRRAPETSKVSHAEMENLLRRPHAESEAESITGRDAVALEVAPRVAPDSSNDSEPHGDLTTGNLSAPVTPLDAPALKPQSKATVRRRWPVVASALLLLAIIGGLFTFVALRRNSSPDTSVASSDTVKDQQLPVKAGADSVTAQLEHAAALERAGQLDEARALYQQLSNSTSDDATRQTAQQRLAELSPVPPAADRNPSGNSANDDNANAGNAAPNLPQRNERAADVRNTTRPTLPAPSAAAVPSMPLEPGERTLPGTSLSPRASSRNPARATPNDPDSYYIKGLSVLNAREPKALQRAEVGQALEYFQRAAQPGGTHREQARQYAERLGKELDKRRQKEKH
ncbi:MAG: hypothetical protein ABR577_07665 [Pyrinomonadaceae bacterium]